LKGERKLTDEKLQILKDSLLKEKEEILSLLNNSKNYGLDNPLNASIGELSGYDNHPADLGTELFERGKDIALKENEKHLLLMIDEALERIEKGTYGKCIVCGEEISYERLEAVPYAKYCYEHQPNRYLSEQRSIEEYLDEPIMGNVFEGEESDVEFDGEDAWQAVAKYGTSNTPSDFIDLANPDYNHMYINSDEAIGYVEPLEALAITDITGNNSDEKRDIVINDEYKDFMEEGLLEEVILDKRKLEDLNGK